MSRVSRLLLGIGIAVSGLTELHTAAQSLFPPVTTPTPLVEGSTQPVLQPPDTQPSDRQTSDPMTLYRREVINPQPFQQDQPPEPEQVRTAADNPIFDINLNQQLGPEQEGTGSGQGNRYQGGATGENSGSGTGQGGGRGTGSGSGHGLGGGAGQGEGLQTGTQQGRQQITGLILDARGLDFQPSMSMRVFDPEGNQIYTTPGSHEDLNTYLVASQGTAAYATSEEQARSLLNRIGEQPLLIRAVKTLGYDLVVSNQDAWTLWQQNEADGFLDRYAVVVIWEPTVSQAP
ncbi:MAG: hypothetical protein HC921_21420 [Synechococcaceae cyanobacterium SM2_3_1]|nr:hypothetical protein [Synechococcaceae cyanobacterium SM2_3_1]